MVTALLYTLSAILAGSALAAFLLSAWIDVKERIIPNDLVVLIAISGIGLCLILRPHEIWISWPAALLILISLGVLAHLGVMGGGDVKLISAATFLVAPGQIVQLLFLIAVSGGILSGIYLIAGYGLRRSGFGKSLLLAAAAPQANSNGYTLLTKECTRIAAGDPMPYALAILGGTMWTVAGELPRCLFVDFCLY